MVWKYGWILWRRYWVKRHRVKKEAIAESGSLTIYVLAKVSLQQTLKCLAVAGLILSHLMNGVMNLSLIHIYLRGSGQRPWQFVLDPCSSPEPERFLPHRVRRFVRVL